MFSLIRLGDGTVPYDSLSYCYTWKEKIPELKVVELPGAEHRDIVSSTDFFKVIINLFCFQSSFF